MTILASHKVDFKILDRPDIPTRSYTAGESIVAAGSTAGEMYVLRKGKATISVRGETVEEIEPGGIFGEMGLIDHAPRSATVTAVVDSEVIPIDERLFVILVQDAPYFALDVMRVLVARLSAMDARLGS
jgi:CRP/FNR family transcriptional regulator, cyclic AMP receptor protein